MSRLIVVATLCAAVSACGRARGPSVSGGEPILRVGLVEGAPETVLRSAGSISGRASDGETIRSDGAPVVITARNGRLILSGAASGSHERILFRAGQPIRMDNYRYRGDVEVWARADRVWAANIVGMEEYLPGVVGVEMGDRPASDRAAVRAQAVASRTYALRNRGKRARDGFDVSGSTSDQAYRGVDAEHPIAVSAVRSTAGEVIKFRGEPIHVFYFSTCGFATATTEEAFETVTNAPYLQSVSDRNGDRYYCDISPNFRWSVEWTEAELRAVLEGTLSRVLGIDPADVRRAQALRVYRTGESGRVMELRVGVGAGEVPVRGPHVRQVLRAPDGSMLRSTAFQVEEEGTGTDKIFRVVGAGSGHGVGMCQWGAIGRSRHGQDYRSILEHYFPGTSVERHY